MHPLRGYTGLPKPGTRRSKSRRYLVHPIRGLDQEANSMSENIMSRREFVRRTAAAAALGAPFAESGPGAAPLGNAAGNGMPSSARSLGTEAEMAIAADWARAFSEPGAG